MSQVDASEPPEYGLIRTVIGALTQAAVERGVPLHEVDEDREDYFRVPRGSLARWRTDPDWFR